MESKGYCHSVIGSREANQDAFLVYDEHRLYAVADGVGGGLCGDVAAEMAVRSLKSNVQDFGNLRKIFEEIQKEIIHFAIGNFGEPLMGTTLTVVMMKENQLYLCHVGDSRCYLYRGLRLEKLSEDQDYHDEAIGGSVLASYLGIPEEVHPLKIQERVVDIAPGDRLLLCTDGLYRQMTDLRMAALIKEHAPAPELLPKKLCEEAEQKEFSDNVTVVYVVARY